MRGHEPLVAMRMRGFLPAAVYVNADGNTPGDWTIPAHAAAPLFAEINVDPSETIARLDLRCLAGLTVHLNGSDPMRVAALKDACMEAGAQRVIAYCQDWTEDTDGALSWPK
jgi:hypothetical protein